MKPEQIEAVKKTIETYRNEPTSDYVSERGRVIALTFIIEALLGIEVTDESFDIARTKAFDKMQESFNRSR